MIMESDRIRNMVEALGHGLKKILAYLENNMDKKI